MRSMKKAIAEAESLEQKGKCCILATDSLQILDMWQGNDVIELIYRSMMAGMAIGYRIGKRDGRKAAK